MSPGYVPFTPFQQVSLGPISLSTHGFFFLLASLIAVAWAYVRVSPNERGPILDSVPWMVLGSLIGGRALYIAVHPKTWNRVEQWPRFWEGGMVSYGAMFGALLALVLFRRSKGLGWLTLLDRLTPPILLGWAAGRLGCFFTWHGEQGVPSNIPWAVVIEGVSYHPTLLYLSAGLAVGAVLLSCHRPVYPGQTALLGLGSYAVLRGASDVLRVYDPAYLRTLSQVFCSALLAICIWMGKNSSPSR